MGIVRYGYYVLNLRSELTNARGQKREFTYDALGRIVSEVNLDKNDKAYYTYDSLSRVTSKNAVDSNGAVISTESYTYDAAANGFLVGSISGAVSGALGGSTAQATAVAVGNSLINVGEVYLEDIIEDGEINEVSAVDVLYAATTGYFFNKTDGLLKQGNSLSDAGALYQKKIAKEARRANREFAEKNTHKLNLAYDSIYKTTFDKYVRNTLKDEIKEYTVERLVRSK